MRTTLAHTADPDTSHIAAAALNATQTERVQEAILFMLREKPRAAFQLTERYFKFRGAFGWPEGVKPDSIAKRLSQLVKDGAVVDTGRRASTKWGRPAAIWAVAS